MTDRKLWSEAVDIAKDQLRHGKVHYSDLTKATQTIYNDLLAMEDGPVFDAKVIESKPAQAALPSFPEVKSKHEIVDGMVRCAICGERLKAISLNHLNKHDVTRQAYMEKFGVTKEQMQGKTNRKVGDENPLKIMNSIMKEYEVKRGEVTGFIQKNGFKDLKDLMSQAVEKGKSPLDLLKKKTSAPQKKAEEE